MTLNYNLTGPARKALVAALSEINNTPIEYCGAPTFAYRVGEYAIDKTGVLSGPDNLDLEDELHQKGFDAEAEGRQYDEPDTYESGLGGMGALPSPEELDAEVVAMSKRKGIMDSLVGALNETAGEGEQWTRLHSTPTMECGDGRWRNLDGTFAPDAATVADGAPDAAAPDDTASEAEAGTAANVAAAGAPKADKRDLPRLYTLDTPRGEIFIAEEFATHDEAAAEGYGEYFSTALGTVYSYGDDRTFALVTSRKYSDTTKIKRDFREAPPTETAAGQLVIEVPLGDFDPPKLDNLTRLIESKATLIKRALGADNLPYQIKGDRLCFPWFKGDLDADSITAYGQFIAALCETARKKARVTAKDHGDYENPRFSMRLFTVNLGLVGPEYSLIRKLLTKPLGGNGAWRYGDPKKKAGTTETFEDAADDAIVEAFAEDTYRSETDPEARASAFIDTAVAALEANLAESNDTRRR